MNRPRLLRGREERSVFAAVGEKLLLVLLLAVTAAVCLGIWFNIHYTLVYVDGTSMLNTLADGDCLYAEKGEAKRGDVVIVNVSGLKDEDGQLLFQSGGKPIGYIIKRVIALGGDEVYGAGGVVYLKKAGEDRFAPLSEPYAMGSNLTFPPFTVKEGQVFVLGDNRGVSQDSSQKGPLPADRVEGIVPAWAIERKDAIKGAIEGWENFKESLFRVFS